MSAVILDVGSVNTRLTQEEECSALGGPSGTQVHAHQMSLLVCCLACVCLLSANSVTLTINYHDLIITIV